MIMMISPRINWRLLDVVIAQQAEYYGQHNAHVIDHLLRVAARPKPRIV